VKHAAKPSIMPLVPRCAQRETASTIIHQRPPQLMREPCASASLVLQLRLPERQA
jgi:hypothetical protein